MPLQSGRGYQADFFARENRVRDPLSRRRKADKIVRALKRHTDIELSSARCLDVGCSSGLITGVLASHFGLVVGLEYDWSALQAADPTERSFGRFVRGDAMNLPFGDNMLDLIVCAHVYEHVPDDERLFNEIYRVLVPAGAAFFSGPNWLFPIERHYSLPFLHWLPGPLADRFLRLTGHGEHYYERARHLWGLRRLMRRFRIRDISIEVARDFCATEAHGWSRIGRLVPTVAWRLLLPFFPSFNWILYKPMKRDETGRIVA